MLTLAFSGTHRLRAMSSEYVRAKQAIRAALGQYDPVETRVVHGFCIGVDCLSASCAREYGFPVYGVVPADRSRVGKGAFADYADAWEEMPDGTTYRDRNVRLVELADRLIALPLYGETGPRSKRSKRSGTWQTVRLGREKGIPVEIVVLSEGGAS